MGKQSKQPPKLSNQTNNPEKQPSDPPFTISNSEYQDLLGQVSNLTLEELQEEWILAARYGDMDVLHAILSSQIYCRLSDKSLLVHAHDPTNGNTALHMAAANGHVAVCQWLLQLLQQQQPQKDDDDGNGNNKKLLLLAVNHSGNTPLHWAAANGHDAIVELLLKHVSDCDVLQKNNFGRSALTEGFSSQNTNVVKHLLEHDSATEEKLLQGGKDVTSEELDEDEEETGGSTSVLQQESTTINALLPQKNELVHAFDFQYYAPGDNNNTTQQPQLQQQQEKRSLRVRELPIPSTQDCFGDRPELDTTGYGIWAASLIMARWMTDSAPRFQHKTILELGAGCGVPGLAAAFYSDATKVYLTDVNPTTLDNLQYNIQLNDNYKNNNHQPPQHNEQEQDCHQDRRLSARPINWEDPTTWPKEKVDFIIGSDLIYQESIVPILKNVIFGLCQGQGTFMYVAPDTESDIGRNGLAEFIQAMTETAGCELVSDIVAPKKYHSNPLSSQDDDVCFLHFHELTSAAYRLYEFKINLVAP
jgi:ankyrin repeat protein/predicted nicotinamide N-methyase